MVSTTETESNNTQTTADPVNGFGSAADTQAQLTGSLSSGDVDFFSFSLRAGDVIAAAAPTALTLELRAPGGGILVRSNFDASFVYPAESPLPGDRASGAGTAFSYVVSTPGTYALALSNGSGAYQIELEVFRAPLDQGGIQSVFVDFDGAELDRALFDGPPGVARLSPLSAFLPGFGLTSADQNAVIDAIMEEVRESLSADLISRGLNPYVALDLRNSRDHVDPFGDPRVSRVVVGGTIAELGLETIGVAQSIDPGNFALQETAVVLLDLLSGPSGPNSLNDVPRASGASMVALIGAAVGNVVAHEAGHYLGDFHTDNANAQANIMDQGGNLPNLIGLGPDGVFGSADDVDVDFGIDTYAATEGFIGSEDTLNTVAFGISGQSALGRLTLRPTPTCAGRLHIELRDANLSAAASLTLSTSTGDSETLSLPPNPSQPGVFVGGIDTVQGAAAPNDGRVQVQNGALVTVRYQDANTGAGASASVTGTVSVDCQGPVAAGVQVREVVDIAARVTFTSAEPASARLDFGTSCSALGRSVSGLLGVTHDLALTGLLPNTSYFFAITLTDSTGNSLRSDNNGACFSFRTAARTQLLARDFESGLGGFSVSNTAGDVGWHLSSACAAAQAGHSASRALFFGRDSSCNYESAVRNAGSVTSPSISVAGNTISKLRFNYLLQTQQFSLADLATVELSVNGKPFEVVASNANGTLPETAGFAPFSLDLLPYLGGATSANVVVRFAFDTVDEFENQYAGFYVDDVEVVVLGPGTECTSAAQCDDGIFCNGVEVCASGRCGRQRAACDDAVGCTIDRCDESARRCVNAPDVYVCLDRSFCNGQELCKPGVGCVPQGAAPCASGQICVEQGSGCEPPCRSGLLVEGFEINDLGPFEATATVTVNSSAGDHTGTGGRMGADIDDSGSITSYEGMILASGAGSLQLSYWMDVNAFDAGEFARVQYCAANCDASASWVTLNTVGGTSGWRQYQHALPAAAKTDTLRLRWVSTGNGFNEWVHIDDVLLRDTSCTQPVATFNPRPPTLGPVQIDVNGQTGLVRISGTAADPDNDLAHLEVYFAGPDVPFLGQRAVGTTSWSTQLYLGAGEYFTLVNALDVYGLQAQSPEFSFVVPHPADAPPVPLFAENFEQAGLSQFTSTGVVTVSTRAGDRPGTQGTRGADIDDSGRIVSRPIDATPATGPLVLQYWMDVNAFDANEFARVSYCRANCGVESSWVLLRSVGGDSDWVSYQETLPASANTSTLQLRWLSNANGLLEFVSIDDIVLKPAP